MLSNNTTTTPAVVIWHNDNTEDIYMFNDLMIGRPEYSCRSVAKGWGQVSGQIEHIENALLIITCLQLMLESLNGLIFQRHYPYHTVAQGGHTLSPRGSYSWVWPQGGARAQNIYLVKAYIYLELKAIWRGKATGRGHLCTSGTCLVSI